MYINLTQGKKAIVDDGDFDKVNQFKWQYFKHHTNGGYAYRGVYLGGGAKNPKMIAVAMHRFILGLGNYKEDHIQVDHINRNKLDNRRVNLRLATPAQNIRNRSVKELKGISKVNKQWRAQISMGGTMIYLGVTYNPILAALLYDKAASRLLDDFAYLNFPWMLDEERNQEINKLQTEELNKKLMNKICKGCYKPFRPKVHHEATQLYCLDKCRDKYKERRAIEKKEEGAPVG